MGTSKVIVGLGAYVMIGMYTLLFTSTDQAIYNVAQSQAFHDQARQISNAGVKFALGDVGGNSSAAYPSSTVSFNSGSVAIRWRPAGRTSRDANAGDIDRNLQWIPGDDGCDLAIQRSEVDTPTNLPGSRPCGVFKAELKHFRINNFINNAM